MIVRKGELSFYVFLPSLEPNQHLKLGVHTKRKLYAWSNDNDCFHPSLHEIPLYLLISCQPFSTIRYTFPTRVNKDMLVRTRHLVGLISGV